MDTAASAHPRPYRRQQTLGEEIANAVTHGVGAFLAIACLAVAVGFAATTGDPWRIVSVSIYGMMMVVLYTSSTLYHAILHPRAKSVLRVLDHASIHLMIAGSYTPFCLVPLRQHSPAWGWGIFSAVWILAIAGVIKDACYRGRFRKLSVAMYLVMGWIIVVAIYPLWQAMGTVPVLWLVAGGMSYTLGVVFYVWKSLKYSHAIWHLFVLGGTLIHFFTVLFFVVLGPRG